MRPRIFNFLALTLLITIVHSTQLTAQKTRNSEVQRFVPESSQSVIYARPKDFGVYPPLVLLPIEKIFPHPFRINSLQDRAVDEIAVFSLELNSEKNDDTNSSSLTIPSRDWAMVVRLTESSELTNVLSGWNRTIIPGPAKTVPTPEPVVIDDFACYQIPSCHFFPLPTEELELRFTDREGKTALNGLSIGEVNEERGYIQGGTKGRAIFLVNGLSPECLVDGNLQLILSMNVYHTVKLKEGEELSASVVLRNPKTKATSEPITIRPQSHTTHEFAFSKSLHVTRDNELTNGDLFDDLIEDECVEVIIATDSTETFLGVGLNDLHVRRPSPEYIYSDDRLLIVAQSAEAMTSILAAGKTSDSKHSLFSKPTDSLVFSLKTDDQPEVGYAKKLAGHFGGREAILATNHLKLLTGRYHTTLEPTLEIELEYADENASEASRQQLTSTIYEGFTALRSRLKRRLNEYAALNNLHQMARSISDSPVKNLERSSSTPEERMEAGLQIVEAYQANTSVQSDGSTLTVRFEVPSLIYESNRKAPEVLATLLEAIANQEFSDRDFELWHELYRRALQVDHSNLARWEHYFFSVAYNLAAEFESNSSQYVFFRDSLLSMFEAIETHPNDPDYCWLAALVVSDKLKWIEDPSFFVSSFEADRELHDYFAPLIDMTPSRSNEEWRKPWVFCERLVEVGLTVKKKQRPEFGLRTGFYFELLADIHALHADYLNQTGEFESAMQYWTRSEKVLEQLKEAPLVFANGRSYCINQLESLKSELGSQHDVVVELKEASLVHGISKGLARCRLEKSESMRRFRRHLFSAKQHFEKDELQDAFNDYQIAFDQIVVSADDKSFLEIVNDLSDAMEQYKLLSKQVDATIPKEHEGQFQRIEKLKEKANPFPH